MPFSHRILSCSLPSLLDYHLTSLPLYQGCGATSHPQSHHSELIETITSLTLDTAAGTLHTQRTASQTSGRRCSTAAPVSSTVAGEHAGGRAPAWLRTLTPTRPRARAPALPVHAPACTAEGRVFLDCLPERHSPLRAESNNRTFLNLKVFIKE